MKRKLKSITRRLARAESLTAGLEAIAGAVREGLAGSLGAMLGPGETIPDTGQLLFLVQRRVAGLARRVTIRNDVLAEWRECERFYARERDGAVARLRKRLVELRSLAKGVFGVPGLVVLGLAEPTPRVARELLAAARRVTARLRDPNLELPAASSPFLEIDLGPVTEELEADAECLGTALDERAKAREHARAAQVAKDRAAAHFDEIVAAALVLVQGLCELADRPELAGRIRSTTR